MTRGMWRKQSVMFSSQCHAERNLPGRLRPGRRSRSIATPSSFFRQWMRTSAQVHPVRVDGRDQRNFLFPAPAFELLFAPDGFVYVVVGLPIEQAVDIVLAGEARERVLFVLEDPRFKTAGDADVQSSREAAQDVNAVAAAFSISSHERVGILRLRMPCATRRACSAQNDTAT